MAKFSLKCHRCWFHLLIFLEFVYCLGDNITGYASTPEIQPNHSPTFDIMSNVSVWQIPSQSGSDFHFCYQSLFDQVDISFNLISGGLEYSLSKIINQYLFQNISSGSVNESRQNLTFHLALTAGDSFLFDSDGWPTVSQNGTLSFHTASGAAGYAIFNLFLVDDGGTENGGSNISESKKIFFSISPAFVIVGLYLPTVSDIFRDMRQYIAQEASVNPNSLICSSCRNELSSSLSLFDRSNCTGQSSRHLRQNSSFAMSVKYLYRAMSVRDATEFLYFAQKFLDVGKLISLNTTIRAFETLACTADITTKESTFTLKFSNITVSQDSAPYVECGFAKYLVGSPMQITLDGQHFATFTVTSVDNPILFVQFPAIAADGTLSFALAPQRPGMAVVSVALENIQGGEKKFYIYVMASNSAPSFALSPRVICRGTGACICSVLKEPSSLDCCIDLPQNISDVLMFEHITLLENSQSGNQSTEVFVENFAAEISVSTGYRQSAEMTFSVDNFEELRLLNQEQKPSSGPAGSEYASSITTTHFSHAGSDMYVYMAEMLTDSVSVFLDTAKAMQHVEYLRSLISTANISFNSIADEVETKDILAEKIKNHQNDIALLQSRMQGGSHAENQDLIFLDRRRGGEKRIRFVNREILSGSQSPCDLQSFQIASQAYVVVSTGCELTESSAQFVFSEYNRSVRKSNIPESSLIEITKLNKNYKIKLIEDFYKTDSFGTESMFLFKRGGCFDQNSQQACLAMRARRESYLWKQTVAIWEFQSTTAHGSWSRPSMYKPTSCREKVDGLNISPSSFVDLRSKMGPATLRGPACKENTAWDTSLPISLSVETFMINNGVHEALQFDGILNLGLTVSDDISLLEAQGIFPSKALTIETWVTIDADAASYAALIAAAQSGEKYFRGWSLGYSVQNNKNHILWSISVENSPVEENIIAVECDPEICFPGQWIHIAAVYDGVAGAIYVNGKLKSKRFLCERTCGSITYPRSDDGGWEGHTPLVIGAYNNIKTGTIHPHIGAIKRIRIFDVGLQDSDIADIFEKNRDLLFSGIHLESFWILNTGPSLLSPSFVSMPANEGDRQGSTLTVHGRFNLLKRYACTFAYFHSTKTSPFAFPASITQFVCAVPEWTLGFKETVLSILVCIKEPCLLSTESQTLWQRVCLRQDCGYPHALNGTLSQMIGTKTNFVFTTDSRIYAFDGTVLNPATIMTNVLPTSSALPFNTGNESYILAAHDSIGVSIHGISRLYRLLTDGAGVLTLQSIQDLQIPTVSQWTTCLSGAERTFIAASQDADAAVYTWNGTHLIWKEILGGTRGTISLDCFTISNKSFLALARYFDPHSFSHSLDSKIFSLDSGSFLLYQNLSLHGAVDVQHYASKKTLFLVFSQALGETSTLLHYCNITRKFDVLQLINTKKARRSIFFTVPDYGLFMVIAQSAKCQSHSSGEYGECSIMYRWNGTENGDCSTFNKTGCMFLSLTDPYTLMKDVAGGQEFGTLAIMETLRGIVADVIFFKNMLIFAAYERIILDDKESRRFASVAFTLQKENLTGRLSAPSVLSVSPDNKVLIVAEQIFLQREGQSNTSRLVDSMVRLSEFIINQNSGLIRAECNPGYLWRCSWCSHISAMVFATIANSETTNSATHHLYVATSFPGSIHVLLHNKGNVDPLFEYNCAVFVGLCGIRSLRLSKDGSMLYTTSYTESSLSVFIRSRDTGVLDILDTIRDGQTIWDSLIVPIRLNLSQSISVKTNSQEPKKSASRYADNIFCGLHFSIHERHFLGICYDDIIHLLHWENENFILFQTLSIATGAKSIQHLQVSDEEGSSDILVVVCVADKSDDNYFANSATRIFRWNTSLQMFSFVFNLQNDADYSGTTKIPLRAEPFKLYGDAYIGIVYTSPRITSDVASVLYKWDRSKSNFVQKQTFNTNTAVEIGFMFADKPGKGSALLVFVDKSPMGSIQTCQNEVTKPSSNTSNGVNQSNSSLLDPSICLQSSALFTGQSRNITQSIVKNYSTKLLVFIFDKRMDAFIELQRIEIHDAVDIELFSIAEEADQNNSFAATRYFLAIAGKYLSRPVHDSDYAAYDAVSYLYEWMGSGFTQIFNFSDFQSTPEAWCDSSESVCNCADDGQFALNNFFGECATYSPGGSNHGYCDIDGACEFCPISCAEQCKDTCFVVENDRSEILQKRRQMDWNTTEGLRGASKLRHFQVMNTHYLVIGQSVCDEIMSEHACDYSGKVQPKSAVLQWNSMGFQELDDGQHTFALRITAGSVLDVEFMELPSTQNESLRILMFFSQTRGLVAFKWEIATVSGLKGTVDAFGDLNSSFIYVLGEVDKTLTIVQHTEVRDGLNRVASNLKVNRSWSGVDGLPSGVQALLVSTNGNDTNLTVRSFQRQTELACGPIPMDLGSAAASFNFSSKAYCQTPQFNMVQIYDTGDIYVADKMKLFSNGTLRIAPLPLGSGSAIIQVSVSDDGAPKLSSDHIHFSLRIVPASRAPSFEIRPVFIDQNDVHNNVIRAKFVENIRGGAGESVNRTFHMRLISLSHPDIFKTVPSLAIEGNIGYISLSLVNHAFGTADVTVMLTDEMGTSYQALHKCTEAKLNVTSNLSRFKKAGDSCLCHAMNMQSGNAFATFTFTINISNLYVHPSFELIESYRLMADTREYMIDSFARNLPASVNGINQNYVFETSGSGNQFDYLQFFNGALPTLLYNGTLKFSVSEPAMMIFKSVSWKQNSTLSSAPATSGDGIVLLTFSLFYRGGIETDAFAKSCIISIIKMRFPSFVLVQNVINVSASETTAISSNVSFATNISAGFVAGESTQAVTFVIGEISNVNLFLSRPVATSDGTLFFTVKAGASGISTLSIRIVTDNQLIQNSLSSNSSVSKTLIINVTLPFGLPSFQIIEDIFLAEIKEEYTIKHFATNITTPTVKMFHAQSFLFKLTFISIEPWNILSSLPSIDQNGTLRLNSTPGVYGSAKLSVTLERMQEEQSNNVSEKIGITKIFVLHILPSPVLTKIFPAIAPTRGGTVVTIQGADLNLHSASMVEVRVGNSLCTDVHVLHIDELTCILSYGTGLQDVLVSVFKYGSVWAGVRIGGLTQVDLIFAGISGTGSDGYLAAVPRPDNFGNLANFAAGSEFPGLRSISSGQSFTDGAIHTTAFFKDRVYFGGSFLSVGTLPTQYISSFDGQRIMPLGLGVDGPVYALAVYMDLLVVGGAFQHVFMQTKSVPSSSETVEGVSGIAAWNGSHWFSLIESNPSVVHCIMVNRTLMYVSGEFTGFGNQLAVLNGSSISFLCETQPPFICGVLGGEVYAMAVMNNDLFVGGSFTQAGNLNAKNLARWDGMQWFSVASLNGVVYALHMFGERLIIGGEFTSCNEHSALRIAAYSEGSCNEVSEGVNGPVNALSGFGNCLYICGMFNATSMQQFLHSIPIQNVIRWCVDDASRTTLETIDWGELNSKVCKGITQL